MVRTIMHGIIVMLTLLSPVTALAIDTASKVIDPLVKSVAVRNGDFFMGPTVIRLGTEDYISINFDIIGDTHEYLRYRLIHCNADWQPSRLIDSEFVDGFNEWQVTDYAYSTNTYVHYVNYNIIIPNDEVRFLASGNYLLQVYREDDPDDVLLQERFSVSEDIAGVNAMVTSRTDRGFNTEWQQLRLDIDVEDTPVRNPYQDLVVTVTQNDRPSTTRTLTHPLRVESNHVIFDHDRNLIFPAANEYRRFETVRADFPGMHTDSVVFGGTNWHAYLATDTPRAGKSYLYDRTQHGRFMINEYNATDPDLGADYVTVHFTLDSPEVIGGDVYVDGDMTGHTFSEVNRMTYDYNTGLYTLQMPLKQGSYNYQYVVLPKGIDNSGSPHNGPVEYSPDASLIEGNHFETDNEYLVRVYLRTPGSRGDRLIGTSLVSFNP